MVQMHLKIEEELKTETESQEDLQINNSEETD